MKVTGDVRVDEIMPQLNEEWLRLPFEECLLTIGVKYKKLKQKELKATGKIPVVDQGESFVTGYTDDDRNKYFGPMPVIIFGDHTRRVKYVDFAFAVGADGTKILSPFRFLDPHFFYYYLRTLNLSSQGYSRHYKFLKKIDVPVPPIKEQRRIVEELEKLLAKIDDCQKRLAKIPLILKRFRQSILAAACSGRLTADWRNTNPDIEPATALLKQCRSQSIKKQNNSLSDLNEIPDTWVWTVFDEMCNDITVGYVGPMAAEYVSEGIPFLRSLNIKRFRFDPTELKFISREFNERIRKSKLQKGDLVIVRSGNAGISCVIPDSLQEANCSDLVIAKTSVGLIPEYACMYVNSTAAQVHIDSVKVGIAQGHFNIGAMRITPLPLPPKAEQQEIVCRVEELFKLADQIEARYNKAKAYVDKLTQSILAKAFRGELVPQDPNDEPASVLLERIRAERAASEPANKKARPLSKKKQASLFDEA